MKTLLLKKFSAFIPIFIWMFSLTTAKAQIISTDLDPDASIVCTSDPCNQSYLIDLNGDGTSDFNFHISTAPSVRCGPQVPNRTITAIPLNSNTVADARFILDELIGSQSPWSSGPATLTQFNVDCITQEEPIFQFLGTWNNPSDDGYLAVRLMINNQTYYGWVHLFIDGTTESLGVTITDYAYNSIPDQPILGGQAAELSINDLDLKDKIRVYPNPFSDTTMISFDLSQSEKTSLKIFDLNGRLIKTIADRVLQSGEHLIVYDTDQLNAGIYFLQVQTSEFTKTIKLVIT